MLGTYKAREIYFSGFTEEEAFSQVVSEQQRQLRDLERLDGIERYYIDLPASKKVHVSTYEVTLEYGGSEEGGWHYDWYTLIDSVKVKNTKKRVKKAIKKLSQNDTSHDYYSVLGGVDYRTFVELKSGQNASAVRPCYE